MMGTLPLSKQLTEPSLPVDKALPEPIPVPVAIPVAEDLTEVAMLVSEQCSQTGTPDEGSVSCGRIYSNGHRSKVLTQRAGAGDEFKQQSVIEEYDKADHLLYKKTIRQRVDYNYKEDQKFKEKELFDIVYEPTGRKTTRELMVYRYYPDSGKPKYMSWTQYKQIGNEAKAGLVYHSSLRYGEDGSPERGIAEQWANGKKTATFMNWSRISRGYADLDQETWNQWESWIRNVSLQAYLP